MRNHEETIFAHGIIDIVGHIFSTHASTPHELFHHHALAIVRATCAWRAKRLFLVNRLASRWGSWIDRSAIPGGDCGFDLPAYQHWLAQGSAAQSRDLKAWTGYLQPFEQSINMLLRLLRDSTEPGLHTAKKGVLVHNMDPSTQLIRVLLDDGRVFPEISAGRHRATIRFVEVQDKKLRVRQYPSNVEFRMACCRF